MESLDGALREMHRVLRPGGRVAILEFSHPENAVVRALYMPYFLHVLPRIGALLSQRSAYLYLPHSVLHFPGRHELATRMRAAGFARVRHAALSMGIAALHIGERAR
jgi:demethylmenaquinone methyltransferase/2-methoxy-6-polyprenyl-1,4-benzoquinol methylase